MPPYTRKNRIVLTGNISHCFTTNKALSSTFPTSMPAVFLQVADELGGTVGLDERGALLEKPAPCLVFFVLLHSTVIVVTAIERWPQAVDPHLAAVLANQLQQALHIAVRLAETALDGYGVNCGAGVDFLLGIGIGECDDGHVDDLAYHIALLALHLADGLVRLDDHLARGTRLLHHLISLAEVLVALIDIDENLSLAQVERLLKGGNRVAGAYSMARLEAELLQFGRCEVAHLAVTGGCAVHRIVMHEEEHAVLGHVQVEFYHIHTHIYAVLESLQGVLGSVAPVAAVSHHQHFLRLGIVQLTNEFIHALLCCRHESQTEEQTQSNCPFHTV